MTASDLPNTVGGYVTLIRGTTYKGTLVGQPGPALLGLGSIEPGGGFRTQDYQTYGGDCPDELMLFPGDIYASLKGATKDGKMIGSVARVPPGVKSGRLTQDTVKLLFRRADSKDNSYIYWLLRTPQYRDYCAGHATGSAVVALSRRDFLAYPVPLLTAELQSAVAALDAVEARIELNRQMSGTLEATARAIFKSWFVHFDPVRAKTEGRNTGLPKHIADLFPDSFGESELGEVPQTWKVGTLVDLSILNPEVWTKDTRPAELKYVDLSNTKWGRIEAVTRYLAADAPSRAQRVLRPADTIVGTVRPGNGSYTFISQLGLTGSTGFAVLRPRMAKAAEFVYLAATSPENIDTLAHLADGAAYPAVRPEVVAATPIVCPSDEALALFSSAVAPLLARVEQDERESRTLAELRDALLSKLISSELRTGDADKLASRVM